MNLSMRWLKEYVDIDDQPRAFASKMTMTGSKVEGYEIEGSEISNVVVGKVISVVPHPDSDHLVICQIDVKGDKPLQIVTGASNVVPNALVPVALDNSTLPGGKKIKKGKLRGELSEGMLCSLSELNLTTHDFPYAIEDGIFLIEEDCEIGEDIHSALGLNDISVEFEITPNRPDCLSMLGLAREAAATYKTEFKKHQPAVKGSGGNINDLLSVEVANTELCPRYIARMVKNVKIAPSPRWMRERLRACGVRPINNLVDITNYVMLEYGQPLHAFDANLLKGDKKKILVRTAAKGENITTLDGIERKLNEKMLVITDGERPVAVAGVMGGENSAIIDSTNTVIFESAAFKGSSVRTTSRDLGLRTDASSKYEKGLDPQNTYGAIMRACELVEELGAGEVIEGIIDINNTPKFERKIPLDPEWINKFLGIELPEKDMIDILTRLDIKVENGIVEVPSFRADIEDKADIAEEIARLYGYNNIPVTIVSGAASGKITDEQRFERNVHKILQGCGCFETMTYSFVSPKQYDKINLPADSPLRNNVVITNPLGEDTSVMRSTMLPSILEVLARNYNNRNEKMYCYEIGNEYIPTSIDELPNENPQITIGLYGGKTDFYTLKAIIETLLKHLHVDSYDIAAVTDNPSFHPGRCAALSVGETPIGIFGEIHPIVLQSYGIDTKAYVAKLDLKSLYSVHQTEINYKPLPRFPATTRDLSLICDIDTPVIEIEKAIKEAVGATLERVKLFDVYTGSQIAENKKSVSYSIVMRSDNGTLTDGEATAAINRVLKRLEKINITLRS